MSGTVDPEGPKWSTLQPSNEDDLTDMRLLIRPLILPEKGTIKVGHSSGSYKPIALQNGSSENYTGDAQSAPVRVIGFKQRLDDIKASLHITLGKEPDHTTIECEFYYDPTGDDLVLRNRSRVEISIKSLDNEDEPHRPRTIRPGSTFITGPGLWHLGTHSVQLLEWVVLRRAPLQMLSQDRRSATDPTVERGHEDEVPRGSERSSKRRRTDLEEEMSGLTEPAALEVDVKRNGPLDLQEGETLFIPGLDDLEPYQLTMQRAIGQSSGARVYLARHSGLGECVVVKTLKIRHGDDPERAKLQKIRQADVWLQEYTVQSKFNDDSIVQLKSWDARYLALYLEYIPAYDLTNKPLWRNADNYFHGSRADAVRILAETSRALNLLHSRNFAHNDIKPANILYSRERGAVLCDFGLSGRAVDRVTNGGTPYYVPPEHMNGQPRGLPGDIWALGVTMLYLLGLTVLPDTLAQETYWLIAEVNSTAERGRQPSIAADRMRAWVDRVIRLRDKLPQDDLLSQLTVSMLQPAGRRRIEASDLFQQMQTLAQEQLKDENPKGNDTEGTDNPTINTQVSTEVMDSSERRMISREISKE